jgi:hypothetical protein
MTRRRHVGGEDDMARKWSADGGVRLTIGNAVVVVVGE